jgi:cytochrome P450
MIHLALHPAAQQTLADELQRTLGGGALAADPKLTRTLPYLQACVRESHRLTPSLPAGLAKELSEEGRYGQVVLPAGTFCFLNIAAKQQDGALVPDATSFVPERWLPDAVAARAGTPAAVIDHPLLATPFGHGARQCLGSRVMRLEILSLLARLVQDWRFELHGATVGSAIELGRVFQGAVNPATWPAFRFVARGAR